MSAFDFAETYANLFCIQAEVSAILDRYREPRDMDAPEFWDDVKRGALADWRAGHIPIWHRNPDGTHVLTGFEDDHPAERPPSARAQHAINQDQENQK